MKQLILRSLLLALICTSCLPTIYAPLHGQESYDLEAILASYERGYHQSLRDVLSVLDNTTDTSTIHRVESGMMMDLQDPYLRTSDKSTWIQYYYQHYERIQYYPEWGMFLRNDLEIPNLSYAILDGPSAPSRDISKARMIYNAIGQKSLDKVIPLIESMSLPELLYSKNILVECLQALVESYSCDKIIPTYAAIAAQLTLLNDQFIHQQLNQFISHKSCSSKVQEEIIVRILEHKKNSLLYNGQVAQLDTFRKSQFISHLKVERYSDTLNISPSFFDNEVDHFGKLLSMLPKGNIIDENELINLLLESESPKALYYIASRWFIYAKTKHPRAQDLIGIITSFLGNSIQVNTPDGSAHECGTSVSSLIAKKAILAFWINNYQHYEWNDDINKYINTNILKQDRQKLIQLYKNLNGDNNELAIKSYWNLLNSDPILLAEVDKIYNKKLLNYNRSLPSRKYKYLLQLSRLVQYCKRHNISYQVDNNLQPILNELLSTTEIANIIRLENKITNILTPENITAFEIWAIVNSGKEHIQYSSTKISNIFYKNHLDQILASSSNLNLFLKKSNLFKKFGDHGSSKYYLKKIVDKQEITLNRLKRIKNEIIDRDIISSVEYIKNHKQRNTASSKPVELVKFLDAPTSFTKEQLPNITKISKSALNKLPSRFKSDYTSLDQFAILQWISIHTPKELLPFIVSLKSSKLDVVSPQDIKVPVKEFATQILSTYISKNDNLSKKWSKGYIKVFRDIFQKNLNKVVKFDELEIDVINNIINSQFYTPDARSTVLSGLTKVKPARNIIACDLSSKLSLEELQYLLPNIKSKNALDYLLKITDVTENDEIMAFLIQHMSDKGTTKAGSFFNDLFKKQWFTEYIDSEATSAELKVKIQWILTDYWETEEGLSSFEEEQTVLNIIKIELAGKSITERLDLILASFVDNEVKRQTIKKILFEIEYKSIPTILNYYDQIVEIDGVELFQFITDDFGIPTQDLSNREAMLQLSADIGKYTEEEIYFKYLSKIGIDLKTTDNEFDLTKAYNIITEDLVRPFVGPGGSVRDIYVFGTIKLLEKEFGKTLGFHPKLNESQSFYKYTSKKRAQAWAEELSSHIQAKL